MSGKLQRQGTEILAAAASAASNTAESFVERFVPDMVVERLFNGGQIQSQELSRVRFCPRGLCP